MLLNMMNKEKIKLKVICPYCTHAWETKSELGLVGCASCGKKFRKKENLAK